MFFPPRLSALCLAALLAAPPPARAAAPPQSCNTIIIPPGLGGAPGADVTSFNPMYADSLYNQEAAWMMFQELVWIAPDHTVDYTRSLASSITTPDQGTTYIITMRPWHWSDGVQVNASDVLYTFNLAKKLGNTWPDQGSGGMPAIVKSFTIQSAQKFTITLTRQVNPQWFILNGLFTLQPVPAHIWSQYSLDQIWQRQSNPAFFQVVDGPLIPTQLASGLDAVFKPNPNWEGPPLHFTRLIMKFMDNEDQELQAVQAHDLDMANLPFALFSKGQHLPGLHLVTLTPTYSWNELIPNIANTTTPYFGDVRVREAMADAINQAQIIQLAMHGQGLPEYNSIPAVPATFLSPAARAQKYPVSYSPTLAKSLLAQAGFTPGPDGILAKGGAKLSFTALFTAGRPEEIAIAETIQQNLAAVGIDMKTREIEFNQLLVDLTQEPQKWQAILLGTNLSAYPSEENGFLAGSFYDNNGYSDPHMDQLINQSTYQPGLAGLYAYQDYAATQQPVIFLPGEIYSVLVRNGLNGVENFINPLGMWAPDALTCTPAA